MAAPPALGPSCPARVVERADRGRHTASRGTYGIRRVHAELTLGLGLQVGHNQVELLRARAGIKGLPGNRRDTGLGSHRGHGFT